MRHDGALSIHSMGELLIEFNADGTVVVGPKFQQDEAIKLIFRALALRYPRWVGDLVASYVRGMPTALSSRLAVSTAVGTPVASDLGSRIYRAVLEEVAMRAEEDGVAAEAREAERQKEQFRAEHQEQYPAERRVVVLDDNGEIPKSNGSDKSDPAADA